MTSPGRVGTPTMSGRGTLEDEFGADSPETRVARRLIEAGDAARRRVAQDLHDGAQQQFVAALINLQRAQQKWESDPVKAKELLDAGVERAQAGLGRLRELVAGIHPPILTNLGLGAAVEDLAAGMPVPVALDVIAVRLPEAVEESVYFFLSEALTNVVKHADASEVTLRIALEGTRLRVEATDDGVGGAMTRAEGIGLPGMSDRIAALNGTLSVTSPAGGGTRLLAEISLAEPV
jgi:signal transduction histidine kinase